MSYKLLKKMPENFSKDILDIFDVLSLKHGEPSYLIGSGNYKINYPSDYDLSQVVPVNDFILKDCQTMIKGLLKMKDVFIGDIKSGAIPSLKIIDDDLTAANYKSKRPEMIEKLNTIYNNESITKDEYDETMALLKPTLNPFDIYIIKDSINFDKIRWKPQDILNGFVNYRGNKIDFYDYLFTESITKIDVIVWINGVRYNEISNLYIFTKNGKPINSKRNTTSEFVKIIQNQIPCLLYEKKYMKLCKRINSLERISEQPDDELLKTLFTLFNSSLGRLSQIISDITVLEFLVENIKLIPKARCEYEIDQMKFRLGNMTNKKYLSHENKAVKLLNELEKDVLNLNAIDKLREFLLNILESETLKFMKEYDLYPVPDKYLPPEFSVKGEGNKITMSKPVLLKEHKKLIKVLESGNRTQQKKEAHDQQQEMSKYS